MPVSPKSKMSQDRKAVKQRMLERLGGKYEERGTLRNEVFAKLVYRMEDLETPAHHPGPAQKRPEKKIFSLHL